MLKEAKTVNFILLVSKTGKYEAKRKVNEMNKAKKTAISFQFCLMRKI
jgi:hypothetical protein